MCNMAGVILETGTSSSAVLVASVLFFFLSVLCCVFLFLRVLCLDCPVLAASLDCPFLMTPSLLLTFIDSLYNKGDYCLLFN